MADKDGNGRAIGSDCANDGEKLQSSQTDTDKEQVVEQSGGGNDDYLRRIMANLMTPSPSHDQSTSSSAIGILVKDESACLSPTAPVQIITDKEPIDDPGPVAQNSPSAAAARWAAKLGAGGKASTGISFPSPQTQSGCKTSWRDDFVAAVQANKRKRKAAAAAAGAGKTKKKRQTVVSKGREINECTGMERIKEQNAKPRRRAYPTEFSPDELEAYKIPLRMGWRREFVYRKTQKKGSTADVYYTAPNGIRLRSLPEVDDYLRTASEKVTRSNFTFRRLTLGFKEIPGAEIVRGALSPEMAKQAESQRASEAERTPVIPPRPTLPAKKPRPDITTETQAFLVASDKPSGQEESIGPGKTYQQSNVQSKKGSKQKGKLQPLSILKLQKVPSPPKGKLPNLSTSNGGASPITPKRTPANNSSVVSSGKSRMQMLRKVAMSESQRKRNVLLKAVVTEAVPSLDAVDATPTLLSSFKNKARKTICIPRIVHDDGTAKMNSTLRQEQEFLITTCSKDACQTKETSALSVPCVTCMRLFHKDCVPSKGRISPSMQFECNECIHFCMVDRNGNGHDADVLERQRRWSMDDSGPSTPEMYIDCSPAASSPRSVSRDDSPAPLLLPIPVSGTAQNGDTADPSMNASNRNTPRLIVTAPGSRERPIIENENYCHTPPLDLAPDSNPPAVELIISGGNHIQLDNNLQISPVAFPFDRYNDFIKGLLAVFSYLPVRDLLNVRLVCQAWNAVSYSPTVWKHAQLRGCRIRSANSWTQAVEFLKKNGTEYLDVSGCGHGNASMRQFVDSALPALSRFVQGFRFGQVLPKLLESTAKACTMNLRCITMTLTKDPYSSSEWISSAALNSLSRCTGLVELRLSAADSSGRRQRVYISSEGLPALATLTNLRVLELFDVRALDETVFKFLDSLPQLRVLEIGDCQCWTRETYSKLCRLINLRRLRLEHLEPGPAVDALAESLSLMQELRELEFIKYSFDYSYPSTLAAQPLSSLSSLPHLHTLRLYPDLDGKWPAPTWRRTVDVLGHLGRLKRLELGITVEEYSTPAPDWDLTGTLKPPFMLTKPRVPQRIAYVNKEALSEWIAEKLPHTVINVADGVSASDLAATREAKWW